MQKEFYLMLENQQVLYFHIEDMEVSILRKDLLPFSLREKLQKAEMNNMKEYYKRNAKNISFIKEYASSRVLSLSRENAKQIYTACNLMQNNSIENRFQICMLCKGINLQDSYWFKAPESEDTWESVNPKLHHLSEIIDVALGGVSPTFTTNSNCPELTTKGLFQKAWTRENNDLYLLKSDKTNSFINTQMELLSSQILDCTDVSHVTYEKTYYQDMIIAKSKNFVPNHMSFVEAEEVYEFCQDTKQDFADFILQKFPKDFANIAVIDYILQNTDRHLQNYGFFMDNQTGELTGIAPLFDHNQALIADVMNKDIIDTMSQMLHTKETIQEIYEKFIPYASIQFDCAKWQELKEKMPEYKDVLERVETRIIKVRCIQKNVSPRHELNFEDMTKDLEAQCRMQRNDNENKEKNKEDLEYVK